MSARKSLARLARLGQLPASTRAGPKPGRLQEATATQIKPIVGELADLGPLDIVLVPTGRCLLSQEWNQLMQRFHYLGSGPLCGAQLRYLIRCGHEAVGGLAFSAAAWQLAGRDKWIGWSGEARRENLPLVVNNSRFLIAPNVQVPNLASHVLSQVVRRLPQDWQARYGYTPVLIETFVELKRFRGTCYAAANWQAIGATQGRTRQDADHTCEVPSKAVWVYPLCKDFRTILQRVPAVRRLAVLAPKPPAPSPPAPTDWAEEELGQARLGDERLVERCCIVARDFYARPQAQLPEACGTQSRAKAAWRFFANPRVSMPGILHSHYEATARRMAQEKVVLAVQDTTSLNYSTHPATEMLGPIGTSVDGLLGMMVHTTLAFNVSGTPLGLVDVQCWTRDPDEHGKRHKAHDQVFEAKESVRWLRSLEALERIQDQCPDTQLVAVGDRESDIYDLFAWAMQKHGRPLLLVRAQHDRLVVGEQRQLWEHMEQQAVAQRFDLQVPRCHKQPARIASMSLRFAQVELAPPKRSRDKSVSVRMWAILAREEQCRAGSEPIEWMLLTTHEVPNCEWALEILRWYAGRWGIEVFHRVLKSGCKIETRQLAGADRLEACLAIDMVVAWRLFYLTKLGRETPDVPCSVFFEDHEWKALCAYVARNPEAPEQPPPLRDAIRMVAGLGGFLGRKSDGEPGTQTIWLGLQRLDDLAAMYLVMVGYPLTGVRPRRYG